MPELSLQVSAIGDDGGNITEVQFETAQEEHYLGEYFGFATAEGFARFTSVSIPNAATIESAVLELLASQDFSDTTVRLRVSANDVDDATAAIDDAAWAQKLAALTTATVDWSPGAWVTDNWYASPDLAAVIQEIIDRPGWASGNALQLIIRDNGSDSGAKRTFRARDHGALSGPKLTITYAAAEAPPAVGARMRRLLRY